MDHMSHVMHLAMMVVYNIIVTQLSANQFVQLYYYFTFSLNITPRGEWADPGGTAIPGQPVGKSEQAPASSPSAKNQFNIDVPQWGTYQILS